MKALIQEPEEDDQEEEEQPKKGPKRGPKKVPKKTPRKGKWDKGGRGGNDGRGGGKTGGRGTGKKGGRGGIKGRRQIFQVHELFAKLENLTTPEAKSSQGLEILVQMVITCQHVHGRRILHEMLTRSSRLDPGSRASIALTITKLSRYSSVCRFLLQAARKYPVFSRVRFSAVCFRAPNLPATELDSMTTDIIHSLLDDPKPRKLASKFHGSSSFAIKDQIRHEATLAVPVHAEVQLLFHYERNPCNLPPRIICSSKQACFLCDLCFRIHGRFTTPSTHGRLYEKWALPGAVKSIGKADGDILTTLGSFVSAI